MSDYAGAHKSYYEYVINKTDLRKGRQKMEKEMFNRVINKIRHMGGANGFESYFIKLHGASRSSGYPGYEEAKRDYRSIVKADSLWG